MALSYMTGFGNEHSSESLSGALPVGQNSPQRCPFGLYAEQLSGTAFTAPRAQNRRTWLYRIHPSVAHESYEPVPNPSVTGVFSPGGPTVLTPNQLRWFPPPLLTVPGEDTPIDWLSGLSTVAGAGSAESKEGLAIHMYTCNSPMTGTAFYNADGELLVVPQEGELRVQTEMGLMDVSPGEIFVIPRGVKFSVSPTTPSRGYVLEVFKGHFQLPELGPLGSNGLANARDFQYPVAHHEDKEGEFVTVCKFGGQFFSSLQHHSPFDVVAWHGNYAPYKYNLSRFATVNAVAFDHPDPSIFTVLTVPGEGAAGVALQSRGRGGRRGKSMKEEPCDV